MIDKRLFKIALAIVVVGVVSSVFPFKDANAGYFEATAGFSFNENDYGDGNYEWDRHWNASLGYHITELTEFEISFQDILDRTVIAGFEDTTFHDQIYSLDCVQYILDKTYGFQPYVKFGVGQLDREASGDYAGGTQPPAILDTVTVILGAGIRVYLTKTFGIRAEGTTYLTGGALSTFDQNFAFNAALSIIF